MDGSDLTSERAPSALGLAFSHLIPLSLFSLLIFVNTPLFPLLQLLPLPLGRCGQETMTVKTAKTGRVGKDLTESTEKGMGNYEQR